MNQTLKNQGGWGLQAMIIFCAVLAIALLITAIIIERNFGDFFGNPTGSSSNNTSTPHKPSGGGTGGGTPTKKPTYSEYEEEVISAAKKYVSKYYSQELLENDRITVTLKSLQKEGYLDILKGVKDSSITCTGYAAFIKVKGTISYEAYLNCGNEYTSQGYLERLDQ